MKISLHILLLLFALNSCTTHKYPKELLMADSLVYSDPTRAMELLKQLRPKMRDATESTKMYYNLLTIKTEDKLFIQHKSSTIIDEIVYYYENSGEKSLLRASYYYAGRIYSDMEDSPRALDYYQKALDTKANKEINNDNFESNIYNQMGALYKYQGLYDNALNMFRNAYENSLITKDTTNMIYDLSQIACIYMKKEEYKNSISHLEKAHKLAIQKKDSCEICHVESYMSMYYRFMGNFQLSKRYLVSSLQNINSQDSSDVYVNAAEVYMNLNDVDSATYYFDKVKDIGSIYAKEDAFAYFTRLGVLQSGDKNNLYNFNSYCNYVDSAKATNSTEAIAKATSLYNYHLKEKENIKLKKKNFHMTYTAIILALSMSLAFLVFVIIIQRYRHKQIILNIQLQQLKREKDSIYRKSTEYINKNKRRIVELENLVKSSGDENEELKIKLIIEKNKLIAINNIAKEKQERRIIALHQIVKTNIYHKLNNLINNEIIVSDKTFTDEDWVELESEINIVCHNFTNELLELCRMNVHEFRVCLLLKINISPSKIAILTNHSETSISATRRRLYEKTYYKKGSPKDWDIIIAGL